MKIFVNGEIKEVEKEIKVVDYLEDNNINKDVIVIEHNESVLKKDKWEDTFIKEGDKLELVKFVGGG